MYIYRADYEIKGEKRRRFFYARNAKIGRVFCKSFLAEDGELAKNLMLTKIGTYNALNSTDYAEMAPNEETMLIVQNFGEGLKFAERDGDG